MSEEGSRVVAEWEALHGMTWPDFWLSLPGDWPVILGGQSFGEPLVPAETILRCRRITSDYMWVPFYPIQYLPAITEALLWEENGMDLGPLTHSITGEPRSWELLQIGGPGFVELPDLRGTRIRQLTLTHVSVSGMDALADLPGLETLTLDIMDTRRAITLPPVPTLTKLVLHSGVEVDGESVRDNPQLRIIRAATHYEPPFTLREIW